MKIRGCGAAGSAPAWHAGGQGFESPQLHRIIRRNRKIPADFLCPDFTAPPLRYLACGWSGLRLFRSSADADWRLQEMWFKIIRLLTGNRIFRSDFRNTFGAVAQLVAHLHGMQGVRGSSPLSSTESSFTPSGPTHRWGLTCFRPRTAGRVADYHGSVNDSLPPCPECSSEYTYEMGALLVCPECAHEWSPAAGSGANEPAAAVIKDAVGNILADGDTVTSSRTSRSRAAPRHQGRHEGPRHQAGRMVWVITTSTARWTASGLCSSNPAWSRRSR